MGWLKTSFGTALTVAFFAVSAPVFAGGSAFDTIKSNPELSTFAQALEATGLDKTLAGSGTFTVFAPTNDAFENFPEGAVEQLMQPAGKTRLTQLIQHHILSQSVTVPVGNEHDQDVTAMDGAELLIAVDPEAATVDGAFVTTANVAASNGTVHIIDEVLEPDNFFEE